METIVSVVTREQSDPALAEQIRVARAERPAAVALRGGALLAGTEGVTVRDGVAHLSIIGPITRYADIFSRVSGLASVEQVGADFQAALDAPEVRAILLELDTPGGEVTGIAALAEAISGARAIKPVWAYVDGMAASAGYWLASGAQRIVTDPAGLLGSIGAVLAVRDPSKGPQGQRIEFVSSQSPLKRADPLTDDGRAQYQRIVDQTAEAFIEAVARNRGVTAADVIDRYGAGGLAVGRYAVEAGLADQVGTFETTLAALARKERTRPMPGMREFWAGFWGGAQDAGMVTPDTVVTPTTTAAAEGGPPEPAPAVEPAQPDVRYLEAQQQAEALAAKLADLEAQGRAQACAAFVAQAQAAGRIVPAQAEALSALYAKAQVSGLTHEVEALIAAQPAHQLRAELVTGDAAPSALPLARATEGETLSDARRRELLSMTPEGRAALAAQRK